MSVSQAISLEYQREEVVESHRLFLRMSRLVTPVHLALWGLAVAAELGVVLRHGAAQATILLGLVLLLAGVALGEVYLIQPGRVFDRTQWMQGPCRLEYSQEGVTLKGEELEVHTPWEGYQALWETPEAFFLLRRAGGWPTGMGRYTLIPKRCFAAPVHCTQFRELALERLGEASHRCFAR